jgi:hypothetical protein
MRKTARRVLLLILFAAAVNARIGAQSTETVLVLVHANLIDGVSSEPAQDATMAG